MKQLKYDVVVIGSGLGGLTSAALLSKAGCKVLVTEKLPFLGGRCATLDYHGYKFPIGMASVEDEIHGELCREVGAEFELHVHDPMYYFRVRGKEFSAPAPGILKTMIREASGDDAETKRVYQAYKRALAWAEPSYSMSVEEWLKQYSDNPIVLGVFQCTLGILSGMRISEIPAGEYIRMLKEIGFAHTEGFLPLGGGSMSDALVRAIKRMGGEVWTRCPALQIKMEDEVATGMVVRKDGEEIELTAQAVMSNAGPWRTMELVGKEHLSPGYLRDVEAVQSVPVIAIYATSDRPLIEGHTYLAVAGYRRLYAVCNYPETDFPGMAPEGKHLVTGYAFTESCKPPYDFKKEVELALQELREQIPDFDKYAQILRINTCHGDWGVLGSRVGYSLPVKTPIERLYLVGDASAPLGWWGSCAAIKSGRLAVEDVIQRLKPA
ncbi:phytoene desaturase family protein [Chloroflexota bacterium]